MENFDKFTSFEKLKILENFTKLRFSILFFYYTLIVCNCRKAQKLDSETVFVEKLFGLR